MHCLQLHSIKRMLYIHTKVFWTAIFSWWRFSYFIRQSLSKTRQNCIKMMKNPALLIFLWFLVSVRHFSIKKLHLFLRKGLLDYEFFPCWTFLFSKSPSLSKDWQKVHEYQKIPKISAITYRMKLYLRQFNSIGEFFEHGCKFGTWEIFGEKYGSFKNLHFPYEICA